MMRLQRRDRILELPGRSMKYSSNDDDISDSAIVKKAIATENFSHIGDRHFERSLYSGAIHKRHKMQT